MVLVSTAGDASHSQLFKSPDRPHAATPVATVVAALASPIFFIFSVPAPVLALLPVDQMTERASGEKRGRLPRLVSKTGKTGPVGVSMVPANPMTGALVAVLLMSCWKQIAVVTSVALASQ